MLDINKKYNYVIDVCLPVKDTIYEVDLEGISNYNFYPTNPCFYIRKTSDQYKISLIYSLSDFQKDYLKFIITIQSHLYHIFIENITAYRDRKFRKVLFDALFNFLSTIEASVDANFLKEVKLNIATIYGDMTFHIEDISNKTVENIKVLQ